MTQKWLRWATAPVVALGLLITLPATSYAGRPAQSSAHHESLDQWRAKRHAIEVTFRHSVLLARESFRAATGAHSTAANRFAARTAFEAAIAEAAAVRASALIALGPNPDRSSDGTKHHHTALARDVSLTPTHVRLTDR